MGSKSLAAALYLGLFEERISASQPSALLGDAGRQPAAHDAVVCVRIIKKESTNDTAQSWPECFACCPAAGRVAGQALRRLQIIYTLGRMC
jgi:hypothetical protein